MSRGGFCFLVQALVAEKEPDRQREEIKGHLTTCLDIPSVCPL